MSTRTYQITLTDPPAEVLDRVRKSAARVGGKFEGDESSGTFAGAGASGRYTVDGHDITLNIDKKPTGLSWSVLESMLGSFFGQPLRQIAAEPAPEPTPEGASESQSGSASRRKAADKVITEHVLWCIGAGLVPIPLFDLAAVTALQIGMLKSLASLFGVAHDERSGKIFVTALTGTGLAKIGASALKVLPGISSLVGGVSMSVMSGASTYALGQVAVNRFEAKGTLAGIDLSRAKAQYERAYEAGKGVVSDLQKQKEADEAAAAAASAANDPATRLKKLQALLDGGLITQQEYDGQRARVLAAI